MGQFKKKSFEDTKEVIGNIILKRKYDTMAKAKTDKRRNTIYKTLHRKLKIKQNMNPNCSTLGDAASCILCAKSMTILLYRRHSFLRANCVLDLFCTSCIPQWRLTTKVGPISILCGPFEGVNIGPYW